jgi:outer membrane receptor protein involved in Fe transport
MLRPAGLLLLSTLLAVLTSPLPAQVTQTGVIAGQVVDVEGEPIVAARVTVINSELIGSRVATITDGEGRFRIPGLPPGVYRIEVVAEGFEPQALEDVHLRVDEVSRLMIVLNLAGEEPVEVPRRPVPLIDITRHDLGETLAEDALRTLPLHQRFIEAFALVPGSFMVGGGPAVRGATPRNNAYLVDGIDFSDPHDGSVALDIVFDSISEIEVTTAMLSSVLRPASGGTMNIKTRFAADGFAGQGSFFFNTAALNGNNVRDVEKPGDHFVLPGIAAGGPAFARKAWFFAGFSYNDSSLTMPITRLSPEEKIGHLINAKSSYTLNDRTDLSVVYFRDGVDGKHYLSPNTALWNVRETDSDRADWDWNQETDLISLGIGYRLSDTVKLHLNGSLLWRRIELFPSSGEIDYKSSIDPLDFIVYRGSPWTEWRDEHHERWMLEGGFDYYLDELAGTHEISLGLALERSRNSSKWDITSGDRIISTILPGWDTERALYIELYRTLDGLTGPITNEQTLTSFSVYAQDGWSPFPKLAFLFGVRYDGPIIDNSFAKVLDWDDISPRIGLSWDPIGGGKAALRFGYARYHSAAQTALAPGDPYYLARGYRWRTLQDLGYQVEPGESTFDSAFNTATRYGYRDPGYEADLQTEAPSTDEYYFSAEYELHPRVSTRLDIVHRRSRGLLEDAETNLWNYYSQAIGTDSRGEKFIYMVRHPGLDGTYNPHLYWTGNEQLRRVYSGVTVSLRSRPARFIYGLVQYTWSKTKGNVDVTMDADSSFSPMLNDPNTVINNYGYLSSDHRHDLRVILHGSLAYGIGLGAVMKYVSGAPYNRLLTIPVEADPFAYAETIFADPRGTVYRLDNQFTVDLRAERTFPAGSGGFTVVADVYNLFNNGAVTERFEIDGPRFGKPLAWVAPRTIVLGVSFSF